MNKGKLVIITGPSAVGKTTVANEILKKIKNSIRVVTYTTRDMRDGEVDGIDYNFITRDEFEKRIKESFFVEWATVYKHYYGNSGLDIQKELNEGKLVILVIDPQGAKTIKEKMPTSLAIFIMPESIKQLSNRLWKRPSANEDKIKTRLNMIKHEIHTYKPICDFAVINKENQLENTIKQIIALIDQKS